jgi:hypothetical protein
MDDGCEFYSNNPERLCVFWPANAVNPSGWQITFRGVEHFFFGRVANTFAGAELGEAPGQTIPVRFVKAPEAPEIHFVKWAEQINDSLRRKSTITCIFWGRLTESES